MSLKRFFRLLFRGSPRPSRRPGAGTGESLGRTTRDISHRGQGARGLDPDPAVHETYHESFKKDGR